jgi:hypothetical protein
LPDGFEPTSDAFEIIEAGLPSGNSSYTYGDLRFQERPLAEHLKKAAVAIILRSPLRLQNDEDTEYDLENDLNVVLACVKASEDDIDAAVNGDADDGGKGGDGDETSTDDGGNSEDAASVYHAPLAVTLALSAFTTFLMG